MERIRDLALILCALVLPAGLWATDGALHVFPSSGPVDPESLNQNFRALHRLILAKQDVLVGRCPPGQALAAIEPDGAVHCERPSDPVVFTHVATAQNTRGNATALAHAATREHPHALLIITPRLTRAEPGHPVAVTYEGGDWHVVHTDGAPITPGLQFNVMVMLP